MEIYHDHRHVWLHPFVIAYFWASVAPNICTGQYGTQPLIFQDNSIFHSSYWSDATTELKIRRIIFVQVFSSFLCPESRDGQVKRTFVITDVTKRPRVTRTMITKRSPSRALALAHCTVIRHGVLWFTSPGGVPSLLTTTTTIYCYASIVHWRRADRKTDQTVSLHSALLIQHRWRGAGEKIKIPVQ